MRKKAAGFFFLTLTASLLLSFNGFAAQAHKNEIVSEEAQQTIDSVSGPAVSTPAEAGISAENPAGTAENPVSVEKKADDAAETASIGTTRTAKKGTYLGTFLTTGYGPTGSSTATGVWPRARHTVSADWDVIPPGTHIRFGDSDIVYTVEDNGVSGNWIDIFYGSDSEADNHGTENREVYLLD